jgi:hypothetical protein
VLFNPQRQRRSPPPLLRGYDEEKDIEEEREMKDI